MKQTQIELGVTVEILLKILIIIGFAYLFFHILYIWQLILSTGFIRAPGEAEKSKQGKWSVETDFYMLGISASLQNAPSPTLAGSSCPDPLHVAEQLRKQHGWRLYPTYRADGGRGI